MKVIEKYIKYFLLISRFKNSINDEKFLSRRHASEHCHVRQNDPATILGYD